MDGQVLARQRLSGGEHVQVQAEFDEHTRVGPEAIELHVVHEDEALLVAMQHLLHSR